MAHFCRQGFSGLPELPWETGLESVAEVLGGQEGVLGAAEEVEEADVEEEELEELEEVEEEEEEEMVEGEADEDEEVDGEAGEVTGLQEEEAWLQAVESGNLQQVGAVDQQ